MTSPAGTRLPESQPKPRLLQDGRDMFWSMAPLVVACIVLAGRARHVFVSRRAGPGPGPAPDYDAPAALQADADALRIPIRVPQLPEGWQANSGSRDGIEAGRTDPATGQPARAVTSTVGYLAPERDVPEPDAEQRRRGQAGRRRSTPDLVPTGTQDVDGVRWVVYEGGDGRQRRAGVDDAADAARPGPAQIAMTGAAGTDEYRTLAAATQSQPPLPA